MNEKLQKAAANNRLIQAYRPFADETLASLKSYYRVGLTWSSNALEGNSLTESETKVVIEDGLTIEGKPLRDVYEAVGHAKAYDFVYQLVARKELTEADVLMLHQLFYQQISAQQAGQYRTVPVFISGSNYAVTPPNKVAAEMKKFVDWFNKNENKLNPVEFAAIAHKKFVFIHPFIDGNGRVARLLMNLALLRHDYTIAIIPAVLRREYIAALEQAHVSDTVFTDFIADRVITTQHDLLRLLVESGGVKSASGGVKSSKVEESGGVKSSEQKLLETVEKMPGLNAPALATQLDMSLRSVQRYLKKLTEQGKISFRGAAKTGGYYKIDETKPKQ